MKNNNYAFIDGQNLYLGISANNWKIDLKRFRVYLRDKYSVTTAYYFLGYRSDQYVKLYKIITDAGFFIIFREHTKTLLANKKGNVDTDIVFEICKNIIENIVFDRVVLVSGDGDYKKMITYLIYKKRFLKILFPNRKFASSLYRDITSEYFDYLDSIGVKEKISHK